MRAGSKAQSASLQKENKETENNGSIAASGVILDQELQREGERRTR